MLKPLLLVLLVICLSCTFVAALMQSMEPKKNKIKLLK